MGVSQASERASNLEFGSDGTDTGSCIQSRILRGGDAGLGLGHLSQLSSLQVHSH